jgi:hypothetical protein
MKKYFNNEDIWNAFLYGSIVGIFAGITIGYLIFI